MFQIHLRFLDGSEHFISSWDSDTQTGCQDVFYFLSMQIGNKKFPVIMRYYCEDILSIFLSGSKIKAYRVFYSELYISQTKEIKAKK